MTRWNLVLSESASQDISDILELLLTTRGPEHAVKVDGELDRVLQTLERFPKRGRIVPELRERGITTYREVLTLPYRVIYRIAEEDVFVFSVVDHRRDLDGLLHARARRDR